MWWKGDVETRYKYLYNQDEMNELAGRIRAAAEKTSLLFVFFNNHWRGGSARNAIDCMRTLQLPLKDVPPPPLAMPLDGQKSGGLSPSVP